MKRNSEGEIKQENAHQEVEINTTSSSHTLTSSITITLTPSSDLNQIITRLQLEQPAELVIIVNGPLSKLLFDLLESIKNNFSFITEVSIFYKKKSQELGAHKVLCNLLSKNSHKTLICSIEKKILDEETETDTEMETDEAIRTDEVMEINEKMEIDLYEKTTTAETFTMIMQNFVNSIVNCLESNSSLTKLIIEEPLTHEQIFTLITASAGHDSLTELHCYTLDGKTLEITDNFEEQIGLLLIEKPKLLRILIDEEMLYQKGIPLIFKGGKKLLEKNNTLTRENENLTQENEELKQNNEKINEELKKLKQKIEELEEQQSEASKQKEESTVEEVKEEVSQPAEKCLRVKEGQLSQKHLPNSSAFPWGNVSVASTNPDTALSTPRENTTPTSFIS